MFKNDLFLSDLSSLSFSEKSLGFNLSYMEQENKLVLFVPLRNMARQTVTFNKVANGFVLSYVSETMEQFKPFHIYNNGRVYSKGMITAELRLYMFRLRMSLKK